MSLFRIVLLSTVITGVILIGARSDAASPASGTLSATTRSLAYSGGPFFVANTTGQATDPDPPICNSEGQDCDHYALTVDLPADYHDTNPNDQIVVSVSWPSPTGQEDFDIYLLNPDGSQKAKAATSANPEVMKIPACPGKKDFQILAAPFAPNGQGYSATVKLVDSGSEVNCPTNSDLDNDGALNPVDDCPGTPAGTVVDGRGCAQPAIVLPAGTPRFHNFLSPEGIADGQGEPGIGCNRSTEKTFTNTNRDGTTNSIPNGGTSLYFGGFSTYMSKITFDDCSSPANAIWEKKDVVSADATRVFGDPIIYTDNYDSNGDGINDKGRTFVAQEVGLSPAGSTIDITDDDGTTFTPSDSTVGSGVDHETISAGPYHAPIPNGINPVYPHAVYYASQSIAEAQMQRSDNGGLSFDGAGVTMYTLAQCGGLHGHIQVAGDGTIFVPNRGCGGLITAVVSEDNASTPFSLRPVPNSTSAADDDPGIGVATNSNTIYIGWQSADGHPRISVSDDKGLHWSAPYDVGASVVSGKPVVNTTFPTVVAGDPDRAAFAFFGSETGGANYKNGEGSNPDNGFLGVWYLYVATTFDHGKTWTTQNVTPGAPVQRGGICGAGLCRNQLDFYNATIDKEGRVLVGWDTGCVGSCQFNWPNSYTSKAELTRQTGGKRMYAAFDPVEPAKPLAPKLTATLDPGIGVVNVSWSVPDDSASPITGYKLYRRADGEAAPTLLASQTGTTFNDATITAGVKYYYSVIAINALGEGPFCHEISPTIIVVGNVCVPPGVTKLTDDVGDQTGTADFDIQSISVAEPASLAGKIAFTFKVASLANVTSGVRWVLRFYGPNPTPPGEDDFFIAMTTENSATPQFVYGTTGVPQAGGMGTARVFTISGNLDPASKYMADGTILLVLPRNNPLIGPLKAGDSLLKIFPTVRAPATPANNGIYDTGGEFFYTLRDDHLCDVNTAPVAVLTASPKSGVAPLAVTFSGKGSHDAEDPITDYVFRYGDGGGVQQSKDSVTHTFTGPGVYTASLTVRDARGLVSTVTAEQIVVTDATGATSASTAVQNNRLGGALPLASLLFMGLFAAIRRRR